MLSFFLCYYHQSFIHSNPFISQAHIALLALHIVRDRKRRKDVSLPVSATELRGGRWARVGRGTTFQSKWFHQSCPDYLFWIPVLFCDQQIPLFPLFEILIVQIWHAPLDSSIVNLKVPWEQELCLIHLPAVRPWAAYWTCLCLSFLQSKM